MKLIHLTSEDPSIVVVFIEIQVRAIIASPPSCLNLKHKVLWGESVCSVVFHSCNIWEVRVALVSYTIASCCCSFDVWKLSVHARAISITVCQTPHLFTGYSLDWSSIRAYRFLSGMDILVVFWIMSRFSWSQLQFHFLLKPVVMLKGHASGNSLK